jgi:predicted AAA+ superfamily ATPase
MLLRHSAIPLHRLGRIAEPVLLQGPRGAGKTTLARREFPGHLYINLADPAARVPPRALLAGLRRPAILDEVHRHPLLLEHLAREMPSQPLLLLSDIRLALPCATLELHPPTRAERQRRPALPLEQFGNFAPTTTRSSPPGNHLDWRGSLHQDLPLLLHPRDLDRFEIFCLRLQAQTATAPNLLEIARSLQVAHRTIVRWLAVLERCFLVLRLLPWPESFGRRLVRRPRLHFLPATHCFETSAAAELYRNACHAGQPFSLYYWRDSNGLEIPLIFRYQSPIPCILAEQPTPPDEARLIRFLKLSQWPRGAVISAHSPRSQRKTGAILRYGLDDL